jgi:hypothetical protein
MMGPLLFPLMLASAGAPQFADSRSSDPRIQVWLDSEAEYERGDYARVYVRAGYDGYLLILHADPEGRVRVLFPVDPGLDDFVRGGETLEVRGRGDRDAFLVDERTGSGVVVAAWSEYPFRFSPFVLGDHWDYRAIAPGGLGDDFEAGLLDIVHSMSEDQRFSYDAIQYIVGRPAYDRSNTSVAVVYEQPAIDWHLGLHTGWRSGFSFSIGFGSPFFYDPWYYDPFYSYRPVWYRHSWHKPFWYRPVWYRPWYSYPPYYHAWDPWRYHQRGGVHIRYAGIGCGVDAYCGTRPRSRPGIAWGYGFGNEDGIGWGTGRRAVPRGNSLSETARTFVLSETSAATDRRQLGQRIVDRGSPTNGEQERRAVRPQSSGTPPRALSENIRTDPSRTEPSRARSLSGIERNERPRATPRSMQEPSRTSEPSRTRVWRPSSEPRPRATREPGNVRSDVRITTEPSRERVWPSSGVPRGTRSRVNPGSSEERRAITRPIQDRVTVEPGRRVIPRENAVRAGTPRNTVRVPEANPSTRSREPSRVGPGRSISQPGRAIPSTRSSPPSRSRPAASPNPSVRSKPARASSGVSRGSSRAATPARSSGRARGRGGN